MVQTSAATFHSPQPSKKVSFRSKLQTMETDPNVDDLNKPQTKNVTFNENMALLVNDPPKLWFYLLWVIVLIPLSFPMIFSGLFLREAIEYEYLNVATYYRYFFISILIFLTPIGIALYHMSTRLIIEFVNGFMEISIKNPFRSKKIIPLKNVSRLIFYIEYRYLSSQDKKCNIKNCGCDQEFTDTDCEEVNEGYFRSEKIEILDKKNKYILTYTPLTKYCNSAFVDLFDKQDRYAITPFDKDEKKFFLYNKRIEFYNFMGKNADMEIIIEEVI
jgi:hypothetical protein